MKLHGCQWAHIKKNKEEEIQTKQVAKYIMPVQTHILCVATERGVWEFSLTLWYLKLNISSVLLEDHIVDAAAFSTQSTPLFPPYGDE